MNIDTTKLFTSKQIKLILKVTGCELMHLRVNKKIEFIKRGNAFLYSLPTDFSLLDTPLGQKLLNWHWEKHKLLIDNQPVQLASSSALKSLVSELLIPVLCEFGNVEITYGFTSSKLKRYISKKSPQGTSPTLDQHSAFELNKNGQMICDRGGAACDFYVKRSSMDLVARYIVNCLPFDRLYYYGKDKPLHVSINESPIRHLQIMRESKGGRRYPGVSAKGDAAHQLAEEL